MHYWTSESVSPGHPDKMCDSISDLILDFFLMHDKNAHVAIETMFADHNLIIAGEINTKYQWTELEIKQLVINFINSLQYDEYGLKTDAINFLCFINKQSQDIYQGVIKQNAEEQGAGDQGTVFGFACNETDQFMPAPIIYAHKLIKQLYKLHEQDHNFGRDAKTQISIIYDDNDVPIKFDNIVASLQHKEEVSYDYIRNTIIDCIHTNLPQKFICSNENIHINPTGKFITGGPIGDCGLTGRKIIVDTYGGMAPHGGGAFSGKDPSKIDRSAAYAARYISKNIVAAGIARKCLTQLSYAIGISYPVCIFINTFNTSKINDASLTKIIKEMLDLRPYAINQYLNLKKPIYLPTAAYGHFGREPTSEGHFSWERLDLVEQIKNKCKV